MAARVTRPTIWITSASVPRVSFEIVSRFQLFMVPVILGYREGVDDSAYIFTNFVKRLPCE